MLQQTAAQLRASLEAEKRSAAANQRRMVAENAELIRQLREAQGGGGGGGLRSAGASPSCGAAASPSRQTTCSRPASRVAGSVCGSS